MKRKSGDVEKRRGSGMPVGSGSTLGFAGGGGRFAGEMTTVSLPLLLHGERQLGLFAGQPLRR